MLNEKTAHRWRTVRQDLVVQRRQRGIIAAKSAALRQRQPLAQRNINAHQTGIEGGKHRRNQLGSFALRSQVASINPCLLLAIQQNFET
jgi:hypothetical protein